jgi:transmembrane sensor
MSRAQAIEAQAAQWLMRSEEPGWSPDQQAELDAWLDQSLAHKAAYWRLEQGWRMADRVGALGGGSPEAEPRPRRFWIPAAIAASLVAAVSTGAWWTLSPRGEVAAQMPYATRVGGHRMIALADGSRIELNTATRVRTAVTPSRREVWLDQGEAYFEIRHSERTTFVVHAGPRTITVLGTKFSVLRDGDKVRVAVAEGRVRIDDARADAVGSTTVTRGGIALAKGASTLVTSSTAQRVRNDLAWRSGMLVFDRSTLSEAAAEFNRYNQRQLVVGDATAGAIRIGGTFEASNVDAFVRLLEEAYGLRIGRENEKVIISS